jgi:DNA-binding NtrC family response regulator
MDWTAPRILVIAPAPALRFTIEEVLRAYGYDVITAPSSAAALHLDAEVGTRRCLSTPRSSQCLRWTDRHLTY